MLLPDVKIVENRIKRYLRDYGLNETHEKIKKDYMFYPELRRTMLFILYSKYNFYPFKDRERLC